MKIASPVLIAVSILAGLTGCARDHRSQAEVIRDGMSATRQAVQEVVQDEARRERLLAQADELESLMSAQVAELHEGARRLQALNADPTAERADLERVLAQLAASRRERRSRAIGVHLAMAELTTPEEWEHIVERELEALGPMLELPREED